MSWTDERIETLRTLWEKGLTASQIAEKLGSVSRNAVIGKAHRLGLKSRPSPVKGDIVATPKPASGKKSSARVTAAEAPPPVAESVAAPTTAKLPETHAVTAAAVQKPTFRPSPTPVARPRGPREKVTLLDLSDKICKWPIGHPGEPEFQFCGRPVNPGFPYCTPHCAEAYQAQLPRDRNRSGRSPMPPLPRVR